MPRFEPGQSGNPKGRPPGTGLSAKLRESIRDELPEVLEAIVKAAKDGDMAAARILMDRIVPTLKPVDMPLAIERQTGLAEQGRSVLDAVSAGHITPDQADRLLSVVGKQARVVEIDELVKRIEALENGA
jgi:hypothetical protein